MPVDFMVDIAHVIGRDGSSVARDRARLWTACFLTHSGPDSTQPNVEKHRRAELAPLITNRQDPSFRDLILEKRAAASTQQAFFLDQISLVPARGIVRP